MYRLPKQSMSGAMVKGGEIFQELGEPWVSFNPYWPEDEHNKVDISEMHQWCNLAYHHALS